MNHNHKRDPLDAARQLHSYLLRDHWDGRYLSGPDSGVRFNSRIGRFVKSYLRFLPWSDSMAYFQGQGYWVMDNWLLAELTGEEEFRQAALKCSNSVLEAQRATGYWEYPNPEWRGRIATVEGAYGTLALLESYSHTGDRRYLTGARKWYGFLLDGIGFQGNGHFLAVNYFANVPGGMVPNNSTLVLKVLAKMAEVTEDHKYLSTAKGMVDWLAHVQMETGELPYAVGSRGKPDRPHFLCYQYNAFEFLDLAEYYRVTCDPAIRPVMEKLAIYLSSGVSPSGAAFYDCHHHEPEVLYYAAAVGAALHVACELGLGDYRQISARAYDRVLSEQCPDGNFDFFSRKNYGVLSDRRPYPRNLAMILYHLLLKAGAIAWTTQNEEALVR